MAAKSRPGFVVTPGETHDVKALGSLFRVIAHKVRTDRIPQAFRDGFVASRSHPEAFGRRASLNLSPVAVAGVWVVALSNRVPKIDAE
jgi:hypothetical protein